MSGHVVQAKIWGVFRPFVSDTSPKWTDREGLGKCPTGTRQAAMEAWWPQHTWRSSIRTSQLLNFHFSIDGFHNDVIKLLSQNSEVLRILIYTRLKINKKWIFVQVSILVACLISKIQQFELPSFHSARHQNRNAVSLKPLLLIFSSITISSTVEPRLTTTPFIRPPRYYGHILSNQT